MHNNARPIALANGFSSVSLPRHRRTIGAEEPPAERPRNMYTVCVGRAEEITLTTKLHRHRYCNIVITIIIGIRCVNAAAA